jgi:hypothetical protein
MSKNHQTLAIVVPGANPGSEFRNRAQRTVGSLNHPGSGSGSTIKADVRSVVSNTATTTIVDGLSFGGTSTASDADFSLDSLVQRAAEEGYNNVILVVNPKA